LTPAAIGLGANLGDPRAAFRAALAALAARDDVRLEAVSSIWRTAPWGRLDQPEFLNAAALVSTTLSARSLLDVLLEEEARAGRVRAERWGPRVLDLDLLFHGASTASEPGLRLPHPRLAGRSFVLEPLAEVAPEWRDPRSGRSVVELRDALRRSEGWTACARLEGEMSVAATATAAQPACPR
jgi:2-amino-4-hydroxy-6-hydroxymethyldihydropteridine diphosphokinase